VSLKVFGLIVPKAGMALDAFHDHYRHPHATMALGVSTLREYVQCHRIATDLLPASTVPFEAVAELTFDNIADLSSFREERTVAAYLVEDEARFVDTDRLSFVAVEEEIIQSGPPLDAGLHHGDEMWSPLRCPFSVKLLQFVEREGNPDWWPAEEIAIGRALSAFRHSCALPIEEIHGSEPPYLGVRALWWPTLTAFRAAIDTAPDALAHLQQSAGRSTMLLAQAERFR